MKALLYYPESFFKSKDEATMAQSLRLLAMAVLSGSFLSVSWAESISATLAAHTFLNLDTGAISRTAGDILWDGSALTAQGAAGLYNLGKVGPRVFRSIHAHHASSAAYNTAPIFAATLVAGDVFGVHTNAGHYAKVLVTAANNGSLSLQYTTFHPAAAASAPSISQVLNNYSYVLPGQPNYGIAPGSLFVIFGEGLSSSAPPVLQSSAAPGLPLGLNETSVSVTVHGVTTTPALYYTSATQVAAVLPSTTPVGDGTVTVIYNQQTSAPAPIQVVASAVGLDTRYGTGNGLAVATDADGNVFGLTNSAMPNQTVILWGSGIGADPSNDDRVYPQKQDNLTDIPVQIFIGGISAAIQYRGRSQYPGLDQYNVTVPSNVTPGCFVSIVAQIGNIVSNAVTIPVNATGGVCSDAVTGLSGTQIQSLANKPGGTVNVLGAIVSVGTGPGSSLALAAGLSSSYFGKGYEYASEGSCSIIPPEQGPYTNAFAAELDAGTIQLSGPNGQVNLGTGPGLYQYHFTNGNPGGAYTLSGSGGKESGNGIGSFQVSLTVPTPTLNVTNQTALASVTRAQGAKVTWSGGFPGGAVQVVGSGGAPAVKFFCYAPTSTGLLTVPASILLALPPGPGSITVSDVTPVESISASGLDVGLVLGGDNNGPKIDTTFK
jgi:uncharacterized protein (TIGR03437 family)